MTPLFYSKNNVRIAATALCFFVILLNAHIASGATVEELKNQIETRNQSIKQLELEIAQYKYQLEDVGKQKNSLQNTLKEIDLTQKKLAADLRLTQARIESTAQSIEELTGDIRQKGRQIGSNLDTISSSFIALDEKEQTSFIETLLMYQNTSTLWNEAEQITQIRDGIREHVVDLKALQRDLQEKKRQNEEQKKQLLNLKQDLSDQKVIIEANRKNKANLLAETKNKESNYKKLIDDKEKLRKAFEQELVDYEAQLKFAIDLSKLPTTGSGVLAWPLEKVTITQYFGQTEFSKTAAGAVYNGNGHNGIDLRAAIGTPVLAAQGGVVVGTGNTDLICPGASYGKWILIRHDNGLSTIYGHNSVIRVSANQRVEKGQTIALSGGTGYAIGPHLHFSVLASDGVKIMTRQSRVCSGSYTMPVADLRAYLNPLLYL